VYGVDIWSNAIHFQKILDEPDIIRGVVIATVTNLGPTIELDARFEETGPVLHRILGFLETVARESTNLLDDGDFVIHATRTRGLVLDIVEAATREVVRIGEFIPELGPTVGLGLGGLRLATDDDGDIGMQVEGTANLGDCVGREMRSFMRES